MIPLLQTTASIYQCLPVAGTTSVHPTLPQLPQHLVNPSPLIRDIPLGSPQGSLTDWYLRLGNLHSLLADRPEVVLVVVLVTNCVTPSL